MKLLVMSDSHGYKNKLVDMIMGHPEADAIIFLGDGEWDFDEAVKQCEVGENKVVCQVKGNCDRASIEPEILVREFGGVRVLITHGNKQGVKTGVWGLVDEAKKHKCTAALFGHTHRKFHDVREGVTLINPGSAASGSYCIVDITDENITVEE